MTENENILKPKGTGEFFKWLWFEPILFKKYGNSMCKKKCFTTFLKSYTFIVITALLVWTAINLIITLLDLPSKQTTLFRKEIVTAWQSHTTWFSKFLSFSYERARGLTHVFIGGLTFGLAFGLIGCLTRKLAAGLALGITFASAIWMVFGFAFGLDAHIVKGAAFGLAFGLAFGTAFGLITGLASGITRGLRLGITVGLAGTLIFLVTGSLTGNTTQGLLMGTGWLTVWSIFYFRLLPFYPIHLLKSLSYDNLYDNPYRKDGVIWLPIWKLKPKLISHAKEDPQEAFEFIDFLLKFRPLQNTLAAQLSHTAAAGLWEQYDFDADVLKKIPVILNDKSKFKPPEQWYRKLAAVREALEAANQQKNSDYEIYYYESYVIELKEFEELTLKKEYLHWNHYYFNALEKWTQSAEAELERVKMMGNTEALIIPNLYKTGEALTPEFNNSVFIGRGNLVNELQTRLLSSLNMPVFLVNGQPAVGKTSLLNFLPVFLDTRFKTVYMDLRHMTGINQWFNNLKTEFDRFFNIEPTPLPQTENWLDTWNALQHHLEEVAGKQECKIILAFDEYETIHRYFQKDPEAAANLLDAVSRFSQHQNKIAFLFVGAALFSELKNPHWSNYIFETVLLKVDYLEKSETFKLIDVAKLHYPQEVMEKIHYLTQGHPALVQRICHEMVNTANARHRKAMTMEDLDTILEKHIQRPQNGIAEVFRGQFSAGGTMKDTVRQIIDNQPPTDKKALHDLREHGFVLKEGDGFKMRVPIFEEWVKQFGDVV